MADEELKVLVQPELDEHSAEKTASQTADIFSRTMRSKQIDFASMLNVQGLSKAGQKALDNFTLPGKNDLKKIAAAFQPTDNDRYLAAQNAALTKFNEEESKGIIAAQQKLAVYDEVVKKLQQINNEKAREAALDKDSQRRVEEASAIANARADAYIRARGTTSDSSGSAIDRAKQATQGLGNVMGKATTAFQRFGKILTWRLYRMAAIKLLQSVSEGVKALVAWDREYGSNTSYAAQTVDEIAAKWGEVKKAIGAAAMPILQIIQPALNAVMQGVINIANAINIVFRAIQGYSTYMKATTQAIGSGIDSTTGRAKELQRVLFGFDDLNVLPSQSGSGGGAAAATASPIDFIETEFDKSDAKKALTDILETVGKIGVGLAAWRIASDFFSGADKAHSKLGGIAIAVAGAIWSFEALKTQLADGVTWANMANLVGGLATMTVGLGTAFGKVGTAAGLAVGGVALLIAPLKELGDKGYMSSSAMTQTAIGIIAIGTSISLLTEGPLAVLISLGVAGIFAGINKSLRDAKQAAEALEIERYGETVDNLTRRIKDNAQAVKDRTQEVLNSQTAGEAELQVMDYEMQKYLDLKDKINLTADEKERLNALSDELIKAYPELAKYFSDETGLLEISREEWAKLYEQKLKDIKIEAYREKLIELYKLQAGAAIDLELAEEDLTIAQNALNAAQKDKSGIEAQIKAANNLRTKFVAAGKSTKNFTKEELALYQAFVDTYGATADLVSGYSDVDKELYIFDLAVASLNGDMIGANTSIKNAQSEVDRLSGALDEAQDAADGTDRAITIMSNNLDREITETSNTAQNEVKKTTADTQDKIGKLNKWLGSNPPNVRYKINPLSNVEIRTPITTAQKTLDSSPLGVKFKVNPLKDSEVTNPVTNANNRIKNMPLGVLYKIFEFAMWQVTDPVVLGQRTLDKMPLEILMELLTGGLGSWLEWLLKVLQDGINDTGGLTIPVSTSTDTGSTASKNFSMTSRVPVSTYASGGIPSKGTLYYAGENGSEIVANGPSGGTGVMNMQQMQDAVASGNIDVVNAIYAAINLIGAEIRNKDNSVYLDGTEIGRSVSQYQTNQARRGLSVQGV